MQVLGAYHALELIAKGKNHMQNTLDFQKTTQQSLSLADIQLLTTSNHCGLFMLIDKLISKQSKQRLAEKLLSNFHRTQVIVHPSQNDDPQEFVLGLLAEAREIASNPHDYHGILYTYAKKLSESLDTNKESKPEQDQALVRNWKDFSVHFFQEKLCQ